MRAQIFMTLIFFGLILIQSAHATIANEKVLGYAPSKTGIVFQVQSGGCTSREDFVAEITRAPGAVTQVSLVRIRPDNCHPFLPMGIRFKLSYQEMGLDPGERFKIINENGVINSTVWE